MLFSIHLCWPRVRFGFFALAAYRVANNSHKHTQTHTDVESYSNRFRFLFIYTLSCLPWQLVSTPHAVFLTSFPTAFSSLSFSFPFSLCQFSYIYFFSIIGSIYFAQLFLPPPFVLCLFMLHFDFLSLNCICCFYFR